MIRPQALDTPTRPNTPAEQRAATLAVCDHADDADQARELLLMLGLLRTETLR